ncbi:hypothetical protein V5O48_005987 [Marasmius crinis-equi]|uniref:DUF1764-domain-containing protein n=1 Tax=Marasmius crinis-equi TaxID=585013 RepID=A0ABR3FKR0_9AGAR
MPPSEIDDIFASKGKAKVVSKPAPESSSTSKPKPEKKRKRKQAASTLTTSSAPETVVDPSIQLPSSKRQKVVKESVELKVKTKPSKMDKTEDEARFKDSRGTGPRRKTEEGWSVFKEDELGINDEGGDTPLCPFDCQCCF